MPDFTLSEQQLGALLAFLAGEESFVFLESARITPENHRSFLFAKPLEHLVCYPADDPEDFFRQAQDRLQQGYYLAGWFAYELGYLLEPALAEVFRSSISGSQAGPLAELGVFPAPYAFDHLSGTFAGTGPWTVKEVREKAPGSARQQFAIKNLRLNQDRDDYIDRIKAVKSYIEAGDTYQVNYTLKLAFDFSGSAEDLYRVLRRNQHVSYGALIKNGARRILSFSPELFFMKQDDTLTVRPMKGTIRRGRTLAEDREYAHFLKHDIKNRSENVMIVDLLRNDLGRLSPLNGTGGVAVKSLFDVETYETLHQMTSTVQGKIRPDTPLAEMFRALFPCGSVTGAPKIRTMEIIRELEKEDRGVYTGAIGYLAPTGEAAFNVPIRTVVLDGKRGEMGIGSGIVWDSDPVSEWEECRLKGRFLTDPVPEFRLIETLLWQPDKGYWLLGPHLDRLAESAAYFGFPHDRDMVEKRLADEAASFVNEQGRRVRLTLAKDGSIDISSSECPAEISDVPEQGETAELPQVRFSDQRTDSLSPYLYHKTTVRELYDREREKAARDGFFEVLFVNEKDEVTEGSFTSVFIRKDGIFYTPPIDCGLLPGIFRSYFLAANPDQVKEKILTREDLETAEEVYVANSVRGLVRVGLHRK